MVLTLFYFHFSTPTWAYLKLTFVFGFITTHRRTHTDTHALTQTLYSSLYYTQVRTLTRTPTQTHNNTQSHTFTRTHTLKPITILINIRDHTHIHNAHTLSFSFLYSQLSLH